MTGSEIKYCRNCGTLLEGAFCSSCGQKDSELLLPVKELTSEFIGMIPAFDDRFIRTFRSFIMAPGFLTLEYLSGKRRTYLSPFKIYFFISFIYFFISSFSDSSQRMITVKTVEKETHQTVDSLNIKDGSTQEDDLVDEEMNTLSRSVGEEMVGALRKMSANPSLMFDKIREFRPKIIFLLMPVFALLLKLLYVRSGHLYVKHLVFSFSFHSFIFIVLILIHIIQLIPVDSVENAAGILYGVIPFHLYYSMKRVYGQGPKKTVLKLVLLGGSYAAVFIMTFTIVLFTIIYLYY